MVFDKKHAYKVLACPINIKDKLAALLLPPVKDSDSSEVFTTRKVRNQVLNIQQSELAEVVVTLV